MSFKMAEEIMWKLTEFEGLICGDVAARAPFTNMD